ncbi:MAG: LptF/LptG family permease, partial [Treponema sp.]|nr:LptF/LptG family permease [Treponema sp.]
IRKKRADLALVLEERLNRVSFQSLELENSLRRGPDRESWNQRAAHFAAMEREVLTYQAMKRDRSLFYYLLEFYKKFSIPFGAFSFVFLSVALGLLAKKSGQTVGFILGLIIAVFYWALLLGGQTMGIRMGFSPFWSMWTPNILAITVGLALCIVRIRK